MPIDWFDVEAVRKNHKDLKANPCCEHCLSVWDRTVAREVLKAIAALPEEHQDTCDSRLLPKYSCSCTLGRIWLVAKEVVG